MVENRSNTSASLNWTPDLKGGDRPITTERQAVLKDIIKHKGGASRNPGLALAIAQAESTGLGSSLPRSSSKIIYRC